jgi:hypothetical protein
MYPGKMVAMSENDSIPTLENLTTEKAGWLYFLPWYDGGSDSINFLSNPVFNTTEDLITMYQSDYCITLDELPTDLYTGYSLDGFVDSEPKEPSKDKDDTTITTTTPSKTEEKVVTLDSSDFTETADGFSFTVDDPENISKIELIGSISDTDDSSWYCGGGGIVFGLGDDDEYAFLDYMLNKGDTKVTVKVGDTFKSGKTDATGANLETTGTIHSNTIEVTKWWGSSANDDTGANVSIDITGVKVYYKDAETTSATEATTTTTATDTDTSIDGKVLEINAEENTAKLELDDGSEVIVPLDLLDDTIREDSRVNVKFESGQPVSVTLLTSVGTSETTSVTTTANTTSDSTTSDSQTTTESTTTADTTTTASDTELTTEGTTFIEEDIPSDGDDTTTTSGLTGDVDGNGSVNSVDLLLAKKYALQMVDASDINFDNADVNGDGNVNSVDILNLKKYLLQMLSQDEFDALKG